MTTRSSNYKTFKTLPSREKNKPQDETVNLRPCLEIQDLRHKNNIIRDNRIVCIKFHADWCQPCKVISPKYNKLAEKFNNTGRACLAQENVDLKISQDYKVTGIPAFIFYKNGQLIHHSKDKPLDVIGGDLTKVEEILIRLTSS
jgi:thioredoxin 1